MQLSPRGLLAATLGTAGILLAGCGQSGQGSDYLAGGSQQREDYGYAAPPANNGAPAAQPKAAPKTAPKTWTLNVAQSETLGPIVTDSRGFTLYRFDLDTASPVASNCSPTCLDKWPPALADGTVTVKGIDPKLVGTWRRPDGTMQLTLNHWLLYRFAKDDKPGDVKGQNVEGTWFAITPAGKKVVAGGDGGY